MAVISMSSDVTRIAVATIATDTGTWGNDGGGGGVADEPDVVYQGTTAQSRKVSTTRIGREYLHSATTDMTATSVSHYIAKINATNSAGLLTRAAPALGIKMGNSNTIYYEWYLFGSDNYPPLGGFQIVPINPNIAGYRDNTSGSPSLTAVDYWSIISDFSAGSKAENLVIDAIDVGAGINLVGGDGADPDGVWESFVDYDEGTANNRWGFCTSDLPTIFFLGKVAIGETSAGTSTATAFTDSGKTLIWRNGLTSTGFHRLLIDLNTAATAVNITDCVFDSQGQVDNDGDRGYTTTEDTRPILEYQGTSGTSSFSGCNFTNWQLFTLTSASDMTSCKFTNCGTIDTAGGDISNSVVSGFTGAVDDSAVIWNSTANPSGDLDGMTFVAPSNANHAIEFTATGPLIIDLNDIDFSGYTNTVDSNAAPLNILRTTGSVTINASGCTGLTAAGYKTAGATVNIVLDPVTVQVTTQEADGTAVGSVYTFLQVSSDLSGYPYLDTCTLNRNGSTTVTVTHTAHNLVTGDKVNIINTSLAADITGVFTITVTDANTYTYVSGATTKVGPVAATSTFVLLYGLSNASTGLMSMSKVFTNGQPVIGNARKSSGSPYWKPARLVGTISVPGGLSTTALMLPDE